MTSTRTRMSGRVARIALVLAALASLVTGVSVAQAAPQRASSSTPQWLKAPGLRWQAIARIHQLRDDAAGFSRTVSLPSAQSLKADGLRWQGIARIYQLRDPAVPQYYGSQAPYASTSTRTQPLPRYYGSTAPYTPQGLRADGLRWQGIARVYEQKQTGARAASTGTSNGFAWGDAGIGLAAGIGAMLLAGVAAIGFRRQSRLATH